MRIVIYGICELTVKTAEKFIEKGDDVIIVDPSKEKIEELSDTLDCSFLAGDASHPRVLGEVNPSKADFFFALSDNSQSNLVASLVARSKGIKRTILRVDDPDFEPICEELGLRESIVPSQVTSQYLFDSVSNENLLELFEFMRDKVCLYKIKAAEKEVGGIENLDLSPHARVVCFFRKGKFHHFDPSVHFEKGDEIVLLTDKEHLQEILDRWEEEEV